MAATNMRENFSILPRDVTILILSKLPCTVILRCRFVCKEWLDIVTLDLIFRKRHYENNSMALACPKAIIDNYKTKSKINERGWFYKLDPYRFHGLGVSGFSWDDFDVVNSCKGFLLMKLRFLYWEALRTYVVYNPLTNEKVFLTMLESYNGSIIKTFSCGLGFSSVTKRLKVAVFFHVKRRRVDTYRLKIYTIGNSGYGGTRGDSTTGAWRTVSLPEGHRHILKYLRDNPVELNGFLHWKPTKDRIITRFDVEKEEFGEMSIGQQCAGVSILGVYRGLLYLGITVENSTRVEMWVMEEYGIIESWMRFVVVNLGSLNDLKLDRLTLVDILDTGEIIFLSGFCHHLFSYDPINECFEKLCFPNEYSKMRIDPYTPSFYSFKDF